MNLIEKKCPNCGANLEFAVNDKSCKCEYCKRSFEIERENTNNDSPSASNFNLSELKGPLKVFGAYFVGSYIISAIISVVIFIAVIAFFIFIGTNISKQMKSFDDDEKYFSDHEELLTNVSEIDNNEMDDIYSDSSLSIKINAEGENDTRHSFMMDGSPKKEKVYVAYKKGQNKIIIIYSAVYHDFFNKSDAHTLYIPLVYNNINKNVDNLGDIKMEAPKYNLSADQTCYYYGYNSFEEAYNNVIKPLEGEYTISEK